jgi:DNA-binding response OmpR family regulator
MMPAMTVSPPGPILVVDDDPKILALVRTYLERERFPVVTASDGRAALRAIEQHPRLVVLDLMIPEIDGIEVIRRARLFGDVPILVLSARGAVSDRIQSLTEGADDYLPKPFSPAELVVRVKAILRRATPPAPPEPVAAGGANVPRAGGGRIAHNGLSLDPERHEVAIDGTPVQLTHVEFRILQTLLEADGRVLSRDQLLDAVWGEDQAEVLDRTVDVHIRRLRDKLGDDPDAPRWVATVRGSGYRSAPARG